MQTLKENKSKTKKFGELFAGIGGIGLGLENTGEFEVAWQVEKDPYASRVLEKHWPDVPRHDDVCTFPKAEGNWDVDLIAGGFPCQDISLAGKGAGLEGARSGLFYEGIRIINTLRPRWVLLENVSALLIRGLDGVLGELAQIGYDAEWHCLPTGAVFGAPHRRDRIFILAHTHDSRSGASGHEDEQDREKAVKRREEQSGSEPSRQCEDSVQGVYTNTSGNGLEGNFQEEISGISALQRNIVRIREGIGRQQWEVEPELDRVADGIRSRIHRVRCLGNAVVPQAAQFLGEVILQRDREIFGEE
jgi:DNA (cytosine-5)-methyltransferase 1